MPRPTTEQTKQPNGQPATPPVPPRTLEDHLALVDFFHAAGQDLRPFTQNLVREKFTLLEKFNELRQIQQKLREEIVALTEPEHYPAVITDVHLNGSVGVEVFANGSLIEVGIHPDVDPGDLQVGARGTLAKSRNCLLHVNGVSTRWSDVGTF